MKIRTINRRMGKADTDIEIRSLSKSFALPDDKSPISTRIKYVLVGILVGIVMVKGELISWFRTYEMFKLQSYEMYATFGSAVIVAFISILIIQYYNIKTADGEEVYFPKYKITRGNSIGGFMFGIGWCLTGGGPAALYAMTGSGAFVMVLSLLAAVFGTWMYGAVRDNLP